MSRGRNFLWEQNPLLGFALSIFYFSLCRLWDNDEMKCQMKCRPGLVSGSRCDSRRKSICLALERVDGSIRSQYFLISSKNPSIVY